MEFITSWERQGALAARRETLIALLGEKFGPVPKTTNQRVQSIESQEELDKLLRQLIHANSIAEMGLDGARK